MDWLEEVDAVASAVAGGGHADDNPFLSSGGGSEADESNPFLSIDDEDTSSNPFLASGSGSGSPTRDAAVDINPFLTPGGGSSNGPDADQLPDPFAASKPAPPAPASATLTAAAPVAHQPGTSPLLRRKVVADGGAANTSPLLRRKADGGEASLLVPGADKLTGMSAGVFERELSSNFEMEETSAAVKNAEAILSKQIGKAGSRYQLPRWIKRHIDSGELEVRVFFSSPFGGMETERDILTKHYFPELSVMCEQAGLTFVPIDLRWGITESDAQDALVIEICLREIVRSDIFVGFYGERYGWHGETDELLVANFDRAAPNYPWINDYRDRSVTELEFLAGHFMCPGEKSAAFYFRAKEHDEKMRKECEAKGDTRGVRKFAVESDIARVKRDRLKAATLTSHCIVKNDYKTPGEGALLMYEDLKRQLEPRLIIAKLEKQNRLGDPEAAQHEIYASKWARAHFGGGEHMQAINRHFELNNGLPVVVTGDHGTGKTSLLAHWLVLEKPKKKMDFIYHFVGCSSQSTRVMNLLQRLVRQLGRLVGEEIDPTDLDMTQLTTRFTNLLESASHAKPKGVVIMIDALDEMQTDHHAHELAWLPQTLPANIRMVVSSTDVSVLKQRPGKMVEITKLAVPVLRQIVDSQLKSRGKELSSAQRERILRSPECARPLHLMVTVQELCYHGQFETLDSKIDELLAAPSTEALFELVLKRLDEDFVSQGPSLVGKVLSALHVSRNGLAIPELQAILDLSPAKWSRLYFSLSELLVSRSGLLCLKRAQLRQAVEARYCSTAAKKNTMRELLAKYFEKHMDDKHVTQRVVSELPELYVGLGDLAKLRSTLSQPQVFGILCSQLATGNYDLLTYFRATKDTPEDIAKLLMASVNDMAAGCSSKDELAEVALACRRVGEFLAEAGHFKLAMQPFMRALKMMEAAHGAESAKLVPVLTDIARLCQTAGDRGNSARFYQQALDVCEATGAELEAANARVGLAILAKTAGDNKKALALLASASATYTRLLGDSHPDVAMVMALQGECMSGPEACELLERAVKIREQQLGRHHAATASAQAKFGQALLEVGDIPRAQQMLEQALATRSKLLGAGHAEVGESMVLLARAKAAAGDLPGAATMVLEAIEVLEGNFGPEHMALVQPLQLFGKLGASLGEHEEAVAAFERSAAILEASFGLQHPAVADAFYQLAQLYVECGAMAEACENIGKAHDIFKAVYGPAHSQTIDAADKRAMLEKML